MSFVATLLIGLACSSALLNTARAQAPGYLGHRFVVSGGLGVGITGINESIYPYSVEAEPQEGDGSPAAALSLRPDLTVEWTTGRRFSLTGRFKYFRHASVHNIDFDSNSGSTFGYQTLRFRNRAITLGFRRYNDGFIAPLGGYWGLGAGVVSTRVTDPTHTSFPFSEEDFGAITSASVRLHYGRRWILNDRIALGYMMEFALIVPYRSSVSGDIADEAERLDVDEYEGGDLSAIASDVLLWSQILTLRFEVGFLP